ncbi:MAG TPA: murein biosynthesis integral membrane protein MurJ [Nakamurella sp.]
MTTHEASGEDVRDVRTVAADADSSATDPAIHRDDIAGMKTARTSGVVRAGAVMALATLVSRATGFLAKVVILAFLGFGMVNDAYTIANTLPNIIFELLIGGVLTSVAIPLLSRARADPDGGEGYTQRLMTMAFVGLIGATGLAIAAAPLLTRVYLSGSEFVDRDLANGLALLLLPQIFFYGIAALFGAILNTKEKFGVPAWAPVANNLVVIGIGIALLLTPDDPQNTTAAGGALTGLTREQFLILGLGTTAGIVLQAVVMIPSLLRGGFRFRWRWGGDRRLLEAGQLMLWAVVYVLISQAGYIVITRVASANIEGGIALYSFASLLFQLPYGIVGVSILTAIMPRMSRHAAAGQFEQMKDDASLGNRLSIVALVPIAAGMVVLAIPLTILASLYGAVSLADIVVLSGTLTALALGLVPFAVTLMQMRVFYAMKDARTPALINLAMVGVRVPLLIACVNLPPTLIVPGMALGTTVSYLAGAIVGEIWLRHRYGPMATRRTLVTLGKMTLASAVGGAAAAGLGLLLTDGTVDTLGEALAQILICAPVGLVVIAGLALLLRVEELDPVRRRLRRRLPDRFNRDSAAGSANPGASIHVPDAGHGTLMGGGPAARDPSAVATVPTLPGPSSISPSSISPSSISREQVSEPVSDNRGGGRAAPTADDDHEATTEVRVDQVARSADEPRAGTAESVRADSTATQVIDGSAASALNPGMMVGGRYRLVGLVASDRAGHWFWRAKDTVLPRDMAVTILPDTTGTSATVARTLRAGRLHHVGLPQTLDVGTDHGQSYVVGQWVDGATLTDLVSGGPLDPDVATSITAKLSEAVAEAHRNGVSLGAIHPSLVRVNFDGQVRLSHVIAHASATPDQDIRAIGGLLYLMLTGTWPLNNPTADPTAAGGGVPVPAAPTRLGREIPAGEVVAAVPEALSALAERALHPDEPDGIHAVGAIAALLRSPETVAGIADAPPTPEIRPLSAADRRLIRDRRAKLSLAGVVLAVFAVLIVIALGGLMNQFTASIQNSAPEELPMLDSATATTAVTAAPAAPEPSAPASSTGAAAAGPVPIVGGAVYDPEGDGTPDYKDYVDRAFDGNESSFWLTWVYKQQFPTLKSGVGLTLELEREVSPTQVTVKSAVNGTVAEIRTANSLTPGPLDSTSNLGTATVNDGVATVDISNAPKSKYLIVYVVKLGQTTDNQFQSKINEIAVTGR